MKKETIVIGAAIILSVAILAGLAFAIPAYFRYQRVLDQENEITVNSMKIQQTQQLVEVEKQKALIRVEEAKGISESQKIINATLTDKYLQHEAIQAQMQMANSPNHSTVYIPSGMNGIPLVKTLGDD